jgi:hypothetical protein
MKTSKIIGVVPLVLISAAAFAQGGDDRAVPRGSGGGSSASSDAGSRHSGGSSSSSSSGSSASSNSGSGSGSSASSGGSYSNQSRSSQAAARRPRPGTGTGDRGRYGRSGDRYYGYPNSYYYYDPYIYSWGYPGSRAYGLYGYGYGYYDYGYSYGDYYGYSPYGRSYRYRTGYVAQLRTLVEPAKARVYVDGYYAGIVDDFDGLFQRLNVSPGRHDITFRLEGYKSHTFSIYASPDQTLKLRWDMVRGSGETSESTGDAYEGRSSRDPDEDRDSARDSVDRNRDADAERDRAYVPPSRSAERGELQLDIVPADASVYIDGEFYGKASQVTRLELPAGRHRLEVVRPGYKTDETEVDIDRETRRVTVKLERR